MRKIILPSLLAACVVVYVVRVAHRLENLENLVQVEAGEMKTTWKSGGVEQEVRTARNPGESLESWQERHFEAVRAKQEQFPPDAE